jgi:DNA-binding NtrC family response regulator
MVLDLRTGGMPIESLIIEASRLCSKARIILMSAAPGLASIAKVLGLRFFLQKPFDPDKFLSLVDDARKSGEHASV